MTTNTQERDLRQEWETPQNFFDVVDAEFRFQIDVCATFENSKCETSYLGLDRDDLIFRDALSLDTNWFSSGIQRAWCNPGFANPGPWLSRAELETNFSGSPDRVVVVMALISPSTKWWRDWAMRASEIRLLGGKRVQFVAPEGIEQSSNMRENCLIIFRPNPHNLLPRIWTWDWTKGLPEEGKCK